MEILLFYLAGLDEAIWHIVSIAGACVILVGYYRKGKK